MNMDVKMVTKSPTGFARKRLGTNDHAIINASPPINSTRKKRTLMAIRVYVTVGCNLRELLSSPMGNIRLSSAVLLDKNTNYSYCTVQRSFFTSDTP